MEHQGDAAGTASVSSAAESAMVVVAATGEDETVAAAAIVGMEVPAVATTVR